ncbi:MAG TPA: hypothetical protein VD769_01620 [Gaiellaceae bacterium]|nr:hypothetical protein [Gaiellaceae bacterium]
MPRSLRGLVLAGTLLLAGCGLGGKEQSQPAEQPKITQGQLAAMVLPQAELGAIAEGLKLAADSGRVDNAGAAESSPDPKDTGKSLRSDGRLDGHKAYYGGSDLAAKKKGPFLVGTEVELMEDPVYAAQYLHDQVGDFDLIQGKQQDGSNAAVGSFSPAPVGDEAQGLLVTLSKGKQKFLMTAVAFRRGRVVAVAMVARPDKKDQQNEARALAVKLDKRIQDVLAGRIAADPAKVPAPVAAPSFEGKAELPELTMAGADAAPGLEAVSEGETDGDGYVGYQRTFGEARLGGSHLISMRAETRLYESEAAAAEAAKALAGQVGRAEYARRAAKAFADETQVRPTNVRARPLVGLKRGSSGVVVTFDLVGAKFRIVSIFLRSGRMIETVSGVCRATAFDPDDLRPVAERARKRLAA